MAEDPKAIAVGEKQNFIFFPSQTSQPTGSWQNGSFSRLEVTTEAPFKKFSSIQSAGCLGKLLRGAVKMISTPHSIKGGKLKAGIVQNSIRLFFQSIPRTGL